ncbi:methyltransferase [Hoyosella subflava]|uniref:Hydroxyneurosporene-O-methyltransferase n=1 Tax=Hoyosella subflava (strain DSM 45089 / JCM 17490 / NBRC 109087 / DQS3-9A1) TaxID=443218 RepID=F6EIA6_HOYSD|nr:methyltransferase [Hoyosella subflava]AEF41213.1 Hydroxyneurosporene-O-methyltransferase [Hoyosella subflava DQS3-9A1]
MPDSERRMPPARLVRVVNSVRGTLQKAAQRMVPAPVTLLELITGGWTAQALYVAAKFDIASVVADGPRTADEIAERVGTNPDATYRLMRALATHRIFTEDAQGRFALGPAGDPLRKDSPDTVRDLILMFGHPIHWEHWASLDYSVETGKPALEKLRGMPLFEFTENNEEFGTVFNRAMTSTSKMVTAPLLAAYDFSQFGVIADVGGGHGQLLAAILKQAPNSRGILFDLEPVVAGADAVLREAGVADRCTIAGGSFFEGVPENADAYVMKNIIHDWEDEKAKQILKHIRDAMNPAGKVLLMESVVPKGNAPHFSKWLDLEMLVQATGKERTEEQYRTLLASAGLTLTRVVPTVGPGSIVEAERA